MMVYLLRTPYGDDGTEDPMEGEIEIDELDEAS